MWNKKYDLALLIVWTLVSSTFLYITRLPLAVSGFIFYIVPAIYLTIRAPYLIRKTTIVAGVFWTLFFFTGIILLSNEAWIDTSIFNYRIFGFYDIEYFIFSFFYPYFVIIFYEYFIERDGKYEAINVRIRRLFAIFSSIGIGLLLFYLFFGHIPRIKYSYAIISIIFLATPLFIVLWNYTRLIKKFAVAILFFSFQTFVYEILALEVGYWSFPHGEDKYLSWVTFFGYQFPFEEFLFFIVMIVASVLAYYEYFADDGK